MSPTIMTISRTPAVPPTMPPIKASCEDVAGSFAKDEVVVVAAEGIDVDVMETRILAEAGVPAILAEAEVPAIPAEADVLDRLANILTALKGSRSSFKAVPGLGRCWQPSIIACRFIPIATISFHCIDQA
jgi:hypothetical protein